MASPELDFATLVGSRICHDLISPIGAVNNGLELLSMTGVQSGPEMNLIGESVGNASARIRFFRIAFGAAGDQMVGQTEIESILRDLYLGARWQVSWGPTDPQPRAEVRLAFLALLCLETGMAYGGQITVTRSGPKWGLAGKADKLSIDPELWGLLAAQNPAFALKPAHVQFALLPAIARDAGRQITSSVLETDISLSF